MSGDTVATAVVHEGREAAEQYSGRPSARVGCKGNLIPWKALLNSFCKVKEGGKVQEEG